jgi:hypothetical protein
MKIPLDNRTEYIVKFTIAPKMAIRTIKDTDEIKFLTEKREQFEFIVGAEIRVSAMNASDAKIEAEALANSDYRMALNRALQYLFKVDANRNNLEIVMQALDLNEDSFDKLAAKTGRIY